METLTMADQVLFDEQQYREALGRQAYRARVSLGDDKSPRRLDTRDTRPSATTRPQPKKGQFTMQDLQDRAIVNQGNALARAFNDKEEVRNQVIAAYASGSTQLTPHQIAAVAAIAWNMQLDPNPATGHLYAWMDRGRFIIAIGYQGYLHKASERYQFVHSTRPMTDSEAQLHGLDPSDVGAVCELYEMGRARLYKEIGLEPKPIIGIGVWKRQRFYSDKDKEWKADNVPASKTPLWVAEKNATKDALRQLGLGFSMSIPVIDGFSYDRETESFVENGGEWIVGEVSAE